MKTEVSKFLLNSFMEKAASLGLAGRTYPATDETVYVAFENVSALAAYELGYYYGEMKLQHEGHP